MTRAIHALFFEAPTLNNHNNNNKLFNFFKFLFLYPQDLNNNILKIQNDLFFLSQKKKTFLKIGIKNGASYQTTTLNRIFRRNSFFLILVFFDFFLEFFFFFFFLIEYGP